MATMPKKTPEKLFDTKQAAAYFGCHVQAIKYHVLKTKQLKPEVVAGANVFRQSVLDEFKRNNPDFPRPRREAGGEVKK